jgi:hypothetical protein
MSTRGRPANEDVSRAFKRFKEAEKGTDTAECLSCGQKRAWNPTRLAEHLISCASYQEKQDKNGESPAREMKKQATISMNAISPPQMLKIQKQLALSCYRDGLPFDAFNATHKRLPRCILLIHGGVKFPSPKRIATRLLDGKELCYYFV